MYPTSQGRITQITGAVVDVQFDGELPADEPARPGDNRELEETVVVAASRRQLVVE